MTSLVAIEDVTIFIIGAVVFIAVFTAALSFAYARFEELGDEDAKQD
jgi:hypothetical protein